MAPASHAEMVTTRIYCIGCNNKSHVCRHLHHSHTGSPLCCPWQLRRCHQRLRRWSCLKRAPLVLAGSDVWRQQLQLTNNSIVMTMIFATRTTDDLLGGSCWARAAWCRSLIPSPLLVYTRNPQNAPQLGCPQGARPRAAAGCVHALLPQPQPLRRRAFAGALPQQAKLGLASVRCLACPGTCRAQPLPVYVVCAGLVGTAHQQH